MISELLCGQGSTRNDIQDGIATAVVPKHVMIAGDAGSGKTSLAFRLAYEHADAGGSPLYIGVKARIKQAPLHYDVTTRRAEGIAMEYHPEILSQVKMKYVTSSSELRSLLLGLHAFPSPLSMLLIDDLSFLIDPSRSISHSDVRFMDEYFLILALLEDLLQYITRGQSNNDASNSVGVDRNSLKMVVVDDFSSMQSTRAVRQFADVLFRLNKSSSSQVQLNLIHCRPNRHQKDTCDARYTLNLQENNVIEIASQS